MIMSYFREGREAFKAGETVDSCTYPPEGDAYQSWVAGWDHEWHASHEPGAFE
jgi:hypothetical protein